MPKAGFLKDMATMGIAGLTLFTAVLGGYIAYSLADKLGMIGVQHYQTGCLGAILGGVTVFDMGGPINKVATLFAQAQVNTPPWLMGGIVNILKKPISEEEDVTTTDSDYQVIEAEGEADALAIIAYQSDVAHAFLAAKSLQMAAASSSPMAWQSRTGSTSPVSRSST